MYLRNADLRIFLKKNSKKVLTLNIAGDIFIFVADADNTANAVLERVSGSLYLDK